MPQLEARRRKLGYLEALTIDGDPKAPTVILMHGYGADMDDLASLASVLQVPRGTNWVFPNGHQRIPLGEHVEGRGWFPISLASLETEGGIDLSTLVPPGMKKARELVFGLIEALRLAPSQIILGGFSQGAMIATEVALHLPEPPRGLALLSSTLVNREEWRKRAESLSGFEFFQAHGKYDGVLSFQMAQNLEKLLKEAGWVGKLLGFDGAHEIPPEVIIQLGNYLRKRLV